MFEFYKSYSTYLFERQCSNPLCVRQQISLNFELIFIKIRLFHSGFDFDFDLEWRDVSLPCSPLFRRFNLGHFKMKMFKKMFLPTRSFLWFEFDSFLCKMFKFTNFWRSGLFFPYVWMVLDLGWARWYGCCPFDLVC